MEANDLKEALVAFVVDVLIEARARLGSTIESHLKEILEKERRLLVTSGAPALPLATERELPRSRYLDMKQGGEYFGMKPAAFRKMLDRTPLPEGLLIRWGRRVRIDIHAFEKWLASRKAH
jgi:hypothetical protein